MPKLTFSEAWGHVAGKQQSHSQDPGGSNLEAGLPSGHTELLAALGCWLVTISESHSLPCVHWYTWSGFRDLSFGGMKPVGETTD